jgi:hypothetical protein
MAGASITATNSNTGSTRTTITNSDGQYNMPGLEPSSYDVVVSMSGFAQSTKKVTVFTASTLTLDFTLGVAGVAQAVEVTAEAPLVETSRSEVSGSLRLNEVGNLPVLNRNFSGLMQLIPGARPGTVVNTSTTVRGNAVSFSGAGGRNATVQIDGADNRDDTAGGSLMNFTIEGIQEFKAITHRATAEYGGATGGIVLVTTKSGTNQMHGSAFFFGRNDALTAIDSFTKAQSFPKTPYDREQFGGSFGGPIMKDRWFVFGAFEKLRQNYVQSETPKAYAEALALAAQFPSLGLIPVSGMPQPLRDTMHTVKTDFQINSKQSLFVRWAHELANVDNIALNTIHADLSNPIVNANTFWNLTGGHTYVISNSSLNRFTVEGSYFRHKLYRTVPNKPATFYLKFPNFETISQGIDQFFYQDKVRFADDFFHQIGKHALHFGGDFSYFPLIGVKGNFGVLCGTITWFDDPTVIINNTNGKYPSGFLTPGAPSAVGVGACSAAGATPPGQGVVFDATYHQNMVSAYVQDDWRITPQLTLNLGLRYEVNPNQYAEYEQGKNRVYLALRAIHSIYGNLPQYGKKNFGPRVGFAYDIGGRGNDVIRGGFAIFFSHQVASNNFQTQFDKPTLALSASYVNTDVGVGTQGIQNYVYGVSPLPLGPSATQAELTPGGNTAGRVSIPGLKDPYGEQVSVGYTHQFTPSTVLKADFTHILGLHEFASRELNPIEGPWDPNQGTVPTGTRRFNPAFQAALGDGKILGSINGQASDNRSQYNEFIVSLEHRSKRITLQASYTLASAYAFAGIVAGVTGGTGPGGGQATAPNADQPFAPGEWGPSWFDERHRVSLTSVVSLPWGIQAAPIFQIASARPYTLLSGTDCNADGLNNDRFYGDKTTGARILNSLNKYVACPLTYAPPVGVTCPACANAMLVPVAVNSQRGDAMWDLDARVSRIIKLRSESRTLTVFAEFYNLTNKANFGNIYQGNMGAGNFKQPNGYLPGLPTSRQLQLGARFIF